MDFDMEIRKNRGSHSVPLYSSIINAMTSMKEATAEKIYRKIRKEGTTNYSKPQVDRALANALKYGIFELRNNRYRVRDDVLDDEDTIYWKADINHEETPYRLDSNRGDYINPEKDRRTFRRLSIDENGGSRSKKPKVIVNEITVRKGKIVHKNNKTLQRNNNTSRKTQRNQVSKQEYAKKGKAVGKRGVCPPKVRETEKKIPQRTIRKLTVEDEKKIRRVPKSGRNRRNGLARYEKMHTSKTDEPVCECNYEVIMRDSYEIDCNCEDRDNENRYDDDINKNDNGDEGEDGDENESEGEDEDANDDEDGDEDEDEDADDDEDGDEDEDDDEDEDEDENEDEDEDEDEDEEEEDYDSYEDSKTTIDNRNKEPKQSENEAVHSAFFNYMKWPRASNVSLITKTNTSSCCKCNFQTEASSTFDNDSWSSTNKTQEDFSDLNLDCSDMESNLLNEWCAKAEWFGNRPQNTLDGTVKQFDNALKIEPMDPLTFKNMEEPSYIS